MKMCAFRSKAGSETHDTADAKGHAAIYAAADSLAKARTWILCITITTVINIIIIIIVIFTMYD